MGLAYNNDIDVAASVSLITLLKVGGKVMSVFENQCALLQLSNGWNHRC